MRSACVAVLITVMLMGCALAEPQKVLAANDKTAIEHQRILAELEEVHQLRERMLQEGKQLCLYRPRLPQFLAICMATPHMP